MNEWIKVLFTFSTQGCFFCPSCLGHQHVIAFSLKSNTCESPSQITECKYLQLYHSLIRFLYKVKFNCQYLSLEYDFSRGHARLISG